ncbi:MAG: hypothetical protein ACFCGT_04120 [Sandaracinaceae bacterium]
MSDGLLLLPVTTFKRVFDTTPVPEVVTLPQLVAALRRFELKPQTLAAIERDQGRIEQAMRAVLADEAPRGKFMGKLHRAAEDARGAGRDAEAAVRALAAQMIEDARKSAKRDLRLWSPAVYRPGAAERGKSGVTHVSCLVLDYDDGTSLQEASDTWSAFFHCVHTTWSHRDEHPKFRLCLPLAHPVPAEDWGKVWSWAESHAHFEIDPSMKSPAANYALPAVPHPAWPREAFSRPGGILSPVDEGILTRRVQLDLTPHGPPDGSPAVMRGRDPDKEYLDHEDPDALLGGEEWEDVVEVFDAPGPEARSTLLAAPPGAAPRDPVPPEAVGGDPSPSPAPRVPRGEDGPRATADALSALAERLERLASRLPAASIADDLERLVTLHQEGWLTPAELEAAKARVLGAQEVPGDARRVDKHRHRRTLCVDFDGVLHSYASGWRGATSIPDPPVEGAIAWLEAASERFDLAVTSARSAHPGAVEAMRAWLRQHGLAERVLERLRFPLHKPPAELYLDDRAVRFEGTFPRLEEIGELTPWTEAKRGSGAGRGSGTGAGSEPGG